MQLSLKRILDVLVSLFGLIIFSPILFLVFIIIKLDSAGPAIIKQERVGQDGKVFIMYKFRTMIKDAEKEIPIWSHNPDERITKIGRFLRIKNMDEILQLFNILKGQMSFVGPRPERPFFVEKFAKQLPDYFQRHKLKPGITGWAQVNGFYGDTSIEKRLTYDLYYIDNYSFYFDIFIIRKTLSLFISRFFSDSDLKQNG